MVGSSLACRLNTPRAGNRFLAPLPAMLGVIGTTFQRHDHPGRFCLDGTPITDADIGAMAAGAERGYDVDGLLRRRRGGRPPLGSAAASVESVRLDPELKRALLLRAAHERVSVSEVIRRAIGEYLQVS